MVTTAFGLFVLIVQTINCRQISLMESQFVLDLYNFLKFDSIMIVVDSIANNIHHDAKQNFLRNDVHLAFVNNDEKTEGGFEIKRVIVSKHIYGMIGN